MDRNNTNTYIATKDDKVTIERTFKTKDFYGDLKERDTKLSVTCSKSLYDISLYAARNALNTPDGVENFPVNAHNEITRLVIIDEEMGYLGKIEASDVTEMMCYSAIYECPSAIAEVPKDMLTKDMCSHALSLDAEACFPFIPKTHLSEQLVANVAKGGEVTLPMLVEHADEFVTEELLIYFSEQLASVEPKLLSKIDLFEIPEHLQDNEALLGKILDNAPHLSESCLTLRNFADKERTRKLTLLFNRIVDKAGSPAAALASFESYIAGLEAENGGSTDIQEDLDDDMDMDDMVALGSEAGM